LDLDKGKKGNSMSKLFFFLLTSLIVGCATNPPLITQENTREIASTLDPSCVEITTTLLKALPKTASGKTKETFVPAMGDQTLLFSSGAEVSGELASVKKLKDGTIYYYGTQGPTQLLHDGKVLPSQGVNQHAAGFGSPVGNLKGMKKSMEDMSAEELLSANIEIGRDITLEFESGVVVKGRLKKIMKRNNKNILFTFEDLTTEVTGPDGSLLFEKSWGTYDMVVAKAIVGVDKSSTRVSKAAFEIYKKKLFDKDAQLETIRDLKEHGINFILAKLKEKGFVPVKFLEYVSMEELWEKTILVHKTKGYYGIPFDVGEYGADHGEFSHALQYYTVMKNLTPEELEVVKGIFRNMETNMNTFDQTWERFFEARGHFDIPNTPSYWRKLADGTI
jgi:hypothetical protein